MQSHHINHSKNFHHDMSSYYTVAPALIISITLELCHLCQVISHYKVRATHVFFLISIQSAILNSIFQTSIRISVHIKDINDNPPIFTGTPYIANVSEVRMRRHYNISVLFSDSKSLIPEVFHQPRFSIH